jgi:RNA polymerase sigma-70 factor, ECF subfamily
MTDGELVRQSLAGRPAAYDELVRRWSAPVLACCHARTGSAEAAEDLAQETLLRGFRGLGTLADPDRFGPWLRGIAVRVCLDWLKARPRRAINFGDLAEDGLSDDALGNLGRGTGHDGREDDHQEELRRLMIEVEALPPDYRETLMLYYYQDVTYQDLAELLGVSAATINARLTKGRAMLRARLSDLRK